MWGRLLLSLFWCGCCAFFLGYLRFSAACPAAGYPSRVPHLTDSGWLAYSCSGRLLWGWRCLGTPLSFLPCASAASPSAASPYWVLHLFWLHFAGLLLRWSLVVGLAVSGYTTWFSTLCQCSSPFCCLPVAVAATFLAPVCWSTPAVVPCCWVGGVFAASLGFLPCSVLFLRDLRLAQPSRLQVPLGIFRSPGICLSASLVT